MKLNDFKIRTKLFMLIGLMSVVTLGVSFFGVTKLSDANTSVVKVDEAGVMALTGARLNQNIIALNRTEYRIASDPSAQTISDARAVVEENRKQFDDRFNRAMTSATADEKAMLNEISEGYKNYSQGLDDTYAIAAQVGSSVTLSEAQRQIADLVASNRANADTLQQAVRAYADTLDAKGTKTAQETKAAGETAIVVMISVAAGGLLTGVVVGFLLANYGISAPLNRSVEQLRKLADGNLNVEVTGAGRGDECGDIAKGLSIFKENALRTKALEAEAADQKARAEAERRQVMMEMADDFERSVGGIVGLVSSAATEMQAAAAQLTSTAEETSAQISSEAMSEAGQAARIVEELNEVAASIGGFVDLISGLANQTNLLALNATIESARAGEAGRGFAVVASEVKALAGQTAKATTEISEKIGLIQQATGRASDAMHNISSTIQNINNTTATIASAVEQQNAATQEIVQAVNQASSGTTEVTSNIAGVAQAAEQTGAAASQVLSSSSELAEQAERLNLEMGKFLETVRAA